MSLTKSLNVSKKAMILCTAMFLIINLNLSAVSVSSQRTADPCSSTNQIGQVQRSASFGVASGLLCDDSLDPTVWYRFDVFGTGTSRMPESCVDIFHCGTQYPIWINGSQPTDPNAAPTNVTVCSKTSLSSASSCCDWTDTIQVKLCHGVNGTSPFYVYKLKSVTMCDRAYCFGDALPCNATSAWNAILKTCSTPLYPPIIGVNISTLIVSSILVKDTNGKPFNATRFGVQCTVLGYPPQSVDNGARFDVSFLVNGKPFISNTLGSDSIYIYYNFLNNSNLTISPIVCSQNLAYIIDEGFLIGQLGNMVTCSVVSYWNSSTPLKSSPPVVSKGYWYGLKPMSNNYDLSKIVQLMSPANITFWLQPTFPLTTRHCYDDPTSPCHPIFTLNVQNSNIPYNVGTTSNKCQYTLSAVPGWDPQSNQFTVSPTKQIGTVRSPFIVDVVFLPETKHSPPQIFDGYLISPIPIEIVDNTPRPLCQSYGDPHYATFANQATQSQSPYYSLTSQYGDFYLLTLPAGSRTLEIQVRHAPCFTGCTVLCNCGVIVREDNNIIGINACQPKITAPILVRYLTTQPNLTQTDQMMTSTGPNNWKITLPSGITVTVQSNPCRDSIYLNIGVLGLNYENYTGLCGSSANATNFELSRVPAGKSFFTLNSTNLPQCVNETANVSNCSCSVNANNITNIAVCNDPVDPGSVAVPQFQARFAQDTCQPVVGPVRRHKRDIDIVSSLQNVLVDDSMLYTPLPTYNNTLLKPVINISRADAVTQCNANFHLTPAYTICVMYVNISSLLEACVMDIQLSGNLTAWNGYAGVIDMACLYTIQARLVFSINDSSDPVQAQLQSALNLTINNICVNECNYGLTGNCVNGVCKCIPGYTDKDCSISQLVPPNGVTLGPSVMSIQELSSAPTVSIFVSARNIDSEVLQPICSATVNNTVFLTLKFSRYFSGQVYCTFFTPNLTDANGKPVQSLYSVNISISNDNKLFSTAVSFTFYDNTCMSCSDSGNCSIMPGWCLDKYNACVNISLHPTQCMWTKYPNQHGFGGSGTTATTLDDCQSLCVNTPTCDSIDFDRTTAPNRCFYFIDGNTNRPIVTAPGVDHYVLDTYLPPTTISTTTTTATTTTAVTNPCSNWTSYPNQNTHGASQYTQYTTVADCQSACINMPTCVAIDFVWIANPNQCWINTDAYSNQFKGSATGVTHYDLYRSPDCNSLWSKIVNQHSFSGTQGVGYTTLYACQSLCINTTNCVAIDFDTNQNTCFYFLSPAPAIYPATGVNHYVLVNAPTTTTTVPTLTSNDPCSNWTSYPNQNTHGASQYNQYTTVADCESACINMAACVAIDFVWSATPNQCWINSDAYSNQFKGLAPGVTHYDLYRLLSASCNSVGSWMTYLNQHSYGATQNTASSTLFSCKTFCINSPSCVAIEFDTNLNYCWYYTDINKIQYRATSQGVNQYVKV